MQKIFEGNRGEIYLIDYFGKKAILKKRRPGKPNTIQKEIEFLRFLEPLGFTPRVYDFGSDYIVMEYIQGDPLKKSIKKDPKKALGLALRACYRLDRAKIYHRELGRYYHFMFDKEIKKVWVIDFERAVWSRRPRNVLQFVGFYLRDRELKDPIELYKRHPKEGFERLLEAL